MAIGRKIKHLRGDLAQEELALAAGVSTSTLSRIERELYQPRLPTLRKIAGALGVPVADLLEADDWAPGRQTPDHRQVWSGARAPGRPQGTGG